MYDEIIILRDEIDSPDITGEIIPKYKDRKIFAKVLSIGQKEFYEAMGHGLKPELKFKIADYLDYKNEKRIVYEGIQYNVLRTYKKGKRQLEITVYGGVNINVQT